MKIKVIYKVAGLVMALVMILGNTIQTQAALPAAAGTGPSIYWGAMVNGKVPSTTNLQGVFNTFETRSGKKMSIIHWGESWLLSDGTWGEFQTSYFDNVRNRGSIPMINWDSQRAGAGLNQPNFQLRDVYSGTYDAYIQRWATAAKNWGHPFFMYFDPEMNGWWEPWAEGKLSNGSIVNGNSPGDYVKAWRHVHDIFTSVGANNVTWVWAPNHMSTSSQYPVLSTLYPGDAYVDWTGLSVYNKYPTWAGLNPLLTGSEGMTWFRNSYNDVLTLAPDKPMMLAQWASIEAGDGGAKKAAWITDALTVQIPTNFPKIKAIVWFNWQEVPSETYPIETSQASINAWAAGIALPVYATNQFSNLNASPIPPLDLAYSISGNTGAAYVTLNYTDVIPKTAVSDGSGNYSLTVSNGWNGTVTPFHACYTFNPGNRSYTNVTSNQAGQNYTATFNPAAGCANVSLKIGGTSMGNFGIPSGGEITPVFNGMQTGPVKVSSDLPVFASERALYGSSFNEVMGVPDGQLTTHYWFPWYDNQNMSTWVLVANPSDSLSATVTIKIGGQPVYSKTLGHNTMDTPQFVGAPNGPVEVLSDNPIITSERALYGGSFNEVMGYPNGQLSTHYWFPWYDNKNMSTWVLVANPDGQKSANVTIKVGGQPVYSKTLGPNEIDTPTFGTTTAGPVEVLSDNPIITSERALYGGSFNEVMGVPDGQLSTHYWFPWYDNKAMDTWVLVGNPDDVNSVDVTIKVGGQPVYSKTLGHGAIDTPTFGNTQAGPVEVTSSRPVITSERTLYGSSFNEVTGYPNSQLTTDYWFPWYDNKNMSTWVLVGNP